jgi:hypothetical protein
MNSSATQKAMAAVRGLRGYCARGMRCIFNVMKNIKLAALYGARLENGTRYFTRVLCHFLQSSFFRFQAIYRQDMYFSHQQRG